VNEAPSAEVRLRARRLRSQLRSTPAAVLTGHEDVVACAEFSPDGRRLASAGADGRVILWDAKTRERTRTLQHRSE
jgi:WD40 repeat protein